MGVLSILSVLILGIAIWITVVDDSENGWAIACYFLGIGGIVMLGIFGFGMHGEGNYEKMEVRVIKPDTVVVTKNKIYVEFGSKTITYSDMVEYNTIKENNVIFHEIKYYNYYNTLKKTKITMLEKIGDTKICDIVLNEKIEAIE